MKYNLRNFSADQCSRENYNKIRPTMTKKPANTKLKILKLVQGETRQALLGIRNSDY